MCSCVTVYTRTRRSCSRVGTCPLGKQDFFVDNTLHVLVSKLLNCQNEQVSDKDTKLDVLAILANLVSTIPKARANKTLIL